MPYIVVRSIPPGTISPDGNPSIAGHSWLEIRGLDGSVESFGYYPERPSIFPTAGEIRYTDAGDYAGIGRTSQSFYLSEDQAQLIRSYKDQVDSGQYSFAPGILGDGNNCASFVSEAMQVAGIEAILSLENILPWWSTYAFDLGGELSEALIALNPELNDLFTAARGWFRKDPLSFDLDGDGIEAVGASSTILFDYDGDGIKSGTGWLKSDDGLLVWDKSGNGQIDNGNELFGVDYLKSDDQLAAHGFDALSDLDSNSDGIIDAQDARYGDLRLWRDHNQDGISDAGELQSLAAHGISSIDLGYHTRSVNLGNGNRQSAQSTYTRTDGSNGLVANLDFVDNPFYRTHPDPLDTSAVADLRDMQGSGAVRDLRQAASLSPTLASQLRTLDTPAYVSRDAYLAQVRQVIDSWGATASGFVTSPGTHTLEPRPGTMDAPVEYTIYYQPPGVTQDYLESIHGGPIDVGSSQGGAAGSSGSSGPLDPAPVLSAEAQAAQQAEWQRVTHLITTLERFNCIQGQTTNIYLCWSEVGARGGTVTLI